MTQTKIKLTQYSHGAGCGCKISPAVLASILQTEQQTPVFKNLLVGNQSKDDAAAFDLGNGQVLVSTTDFFMPIVDDPFDFGRIASVNAISDVYAMGAKPILAIAILGFPVDKIPTEVAQQILEGSREVCHQIGIPLAGGHSIDSPEPIFGLAVNGLVARDNLKQNNQAQPGDVLYLTKPLGIGILTTAQKKGVVSVQDYANALESMLKVNDIGEMLGGIPAIHALTDVTGFGLLGHLLEMCEGSQVAATINFDQIPLLPNLQHYIDLQCIPGGFHRNWKSYGHQVETPKQDAMVALADPQTSGGLLIAVEAGQAAWFEQTAQAAGHQVFAIGSMLSRKANTPWITVIH